MTTICTGAATCPSRSNKQLKRWCSSTNIGALGYYVSLFRNVRQLLPVEVAESTVPQKIFFHPLFRPLQKLTADKMAAGTCRGVLLISVQSLI